MQYEHEGEYVEDHIERGEASCEAWEEEARQPDGRYKCCCGKLFILEDGETLSPDPYAIPVCRICARKYFSSNYGI